MLFFRPKYLKRGKEILHGARRLLNYKRDQWSAEQIRAFEKKMEELREAIRGRDRKGVEKAALGLDEDAAKLAPALPHPGWRENCEVILTVVVIVAGIRAYFLQPFKIPTGSMQPTLFGMVGTPTETPPPSFARRAFDFAIKGRTWIDLTAEREERVVDLQESTRLNFFTFTDIVTVDRSQQTHRYTVFAPAAVVRDDFQVGGIYQAGEPIIRGYVDSGDHVFVDKVTYNFRRPALGDVFVFKTIGIRKIQQRLPDGVDSQHYIKRLAGMPGDELRIDPPNLLIDGKLPEVPSLQRVMSGKDGYKGYTNRPAGGDPFPYLGSPEATFAVPEGAYFALGDNSGHSSDSRDWGIVPEENVAGRGFFVIWPFTSRWGLVD